MKRQELFKLGARKTAEAVYTAASAGAELRAANWFRPPFAVAEMDFLIDCTRCDKCITACPHDVLFKLPARYGVEVAGTPAMDLLVRGCHMCEDWPCVAACEPNALMMAVAQEAPEEAPEEEETLSAPLPKLARVEIDTKTCLPYQGPECGACADSCPVPGALQWNGTKPVIDQDACTGCALCREACITEPKSVTVGAVVGMPPSEQSHLAVP